MSSPTLVLVHPDAEAIPDDGGSLCRLGYRLVLHRDPSASLADLTAPDTAGVLFAAQLDSGLPLQICQIAAQEGSVPKYPVFFWGPGGTPAHLNEILSAGATDCFSETVPLDEVMIRIAHRLRQASGTQTPPGSEEMAGTFNKRMRALAHDLKNPLCVLYGYAQMARMGHTIDPEEAQDMVDSSREIREKIDAILTPASEGEPSAAESQAPASISA